MLNIGPMKPIIVPVLALVVTTATGCGGDTSSHAATGHPRARLSSHQLPSRLVVDAEPSGQLKFTKQQLTAAAGDVKLVLRNPSPLGHNIAIKGGGVDVRGKIVGRGGSSTVEANLEPGTYTFYCAVPGHAAAGMTGTLRVR